MKSNFKLVTVIAVIIAGYIFNSCTRTETKQSDTWQTAVVMSQDLDVITFFKLLPYETARILDKSYQPSERTELLMQKMSAMLAKYHLNQMAESNKQAILHNVLELVRADKNHSITTKKAGGSPTAFVVSCTEWWLVTSFAGVEVSAVYLTTTCNFTTSSDDTYAGGLTFGTNPAPRTCDQKRADDLSDCESSAQFGSTLAFAVAAAAMGINWIYTGGTLTGPIALAYSAAILTVTFNYTQCTEKVGRAYSDCKASEPQNNQPPPNPNPGPSEMNP